MKITRLLMIACTTVLVAGSVDLLGADAGSARLVSMDTPVPPPFLDLRFHMPQHRQSWRQSETRAYQACLNEDSVCPQGNLQCCPGLVCTPVGSYGKMCQTP
jgi:hypothetical protein